MDHIGAEGYRYLGEQTTNRKVEENEIALKKLISCVIEMDKRIDILESRINELIGEQNHD